MSYEIGEAGPTPEQIEFAVKVMMALPVEEAIELPNRVRLTVSSHEDYPVIKEPIIDATFDVPAGEALDDEGFPLSHQNPCAPWWKLW